MSLDETLTKMRRDATPPGQPEPLVHLLIGFATGWEARWATYAGYACTGDWTIKTALYQRTSSPDQVTCPGCLAVAR